jgi:hypothetical protein
MAVADNSSPSAVEIGSVSWWTWRLQDRCCLAAWRSRRGGQVEQRTGDKPRSAGAVVAVDGFVERADHDGEGVLAVKRGRVSSDPVPQAGQQAGGHDVERRRIDVGGTDQSVDELVPAILARCAQLAARRGRDGSDHLVKSGSRARADHADADAMGRLAPPRPIARRARVR